MPQSENINELAAALAKAQGLMTAAAMDKTNTHFKTKYATLSSVLEAIRKPLTDNGIAVTQTTELRDGAFCLVTRLAHSSGQWLAGEYLLPANVSPQQLGSALTYARRYSLSAIACIAADEDDDAEGARKEGQVAQMPKRENPHVTRLEDVTDRRYRIDAAGNKYDWIDTSGHRVQHLTGEKAKALYKTLKTAMRMCESEADLHEWGVEHAEQVAMLGKTEDYFQLIEYQAFLDELREAAKGKAA
jgi:hypothetical protein